MAAADPAWLSGWRARPLAPAEALARFDALPAVAPEAMTGRWRGEGLHTGHPLDGVLERLGWHGKAFEADGRAHPLLFRAGRGRVVALDPAPMPAGLALRWPALARSRAAAGAFRLLRPLLRARGPAARLRRVEHRGVTSAAMIYDRKPIIDHFRGAGEGAVLGLMDMDGVAPFFFLLLRDRADRDAGAA